MKLDDMKILAAKGRMSRRDFIQLSLAAGMTVAAADGLFSQAVRAAPKKGGSFKMGNGHGSTTDTLDPATWENGFTINIGTGILGDQLCAIDQNNEVVPSLAESFEPSNGAATWVYKLRKGVTFHNGKSLTADDVVANFNYHRKESSKSAVKSALSIIKDVKADGPDTVVFELKSGSADFPYITSDYHLAIFPAKGSEDIDWQKGIGTGAFVLEDFNPGVHIKGKRNPNYFRDVWFDDVDMLTIADVAARQNALTSGDVHYINRPDLKTVGLIKRNPNVLVESVTGFGHYVAPMDVRAKPFDNPDVRNAVKYCFDREALLKKVLFGYGQPGNDDPIAPAIKYASNPKPIYKYDPDRVKFHLKKAGLTSLKIDLSASNAAFAGSVDCAVLMQAAAKKTGIDINVVREPSDGYWSNVWMKKPWCMSYWGGRPTVDWMMTTAYKGGADWNDTFWKNDRFDELLGKARAETDQAKRAAMYAEMQQILHDDGGIIVLMFNDWVSVSSKKVAHGKINSNYDDDGGYMFYRWWFA